MERSLTAIIVDQDPQGGYGIFKPDSSGLYVIAALLKERGFDEPVLFPAAGDALAALRAGLSYDLACIVIRGEYAGLKGHGSRRSDATLAAGQDVVFYSKCLNPQTPIIALTFDSSTGCETADLSLEIPYSPGALDCALATVLGLEQYRRS